MVRALAYKRIECKNNKSLVQCIDRLTIKIVHEITERLNYITYISSLIFVWFLKDEYFVEYITTQTDRTVAWPFDDYSIIETLFSGDWKFSPLLRLIDCWRLWKRQTGCCWACCTTFRGELKKLASEKDLKKSTTICVQDWTYVVNIKEKKSLLIWNWSKTKQKPTFINCDLSVKWTLEPVDIVSYSNLI